MSQSLSLEFLAVNDIKGQLTNLADYDVIILDNNMKGLEGFQFINLIEPKLTTEKIILISSNNKNIIKLNKFVHAVIDKPINKDRILNIIARSLFDGNIVLDKIPESISFNTKIYNKVHTLIVEDNSVNRDILKSVLNNYGIIVHEATNGLNGLNKFKQNPNKYNLILTDLHMPIMNGIEMSRKIRQESNIPIIILTADVYSNMPQLSMDAGVNRFLTKPIDIPELYNVIINLAKNTIKNILIATNNNSDIEIIKAYTEEYNIKCHKSHDGNDVIKRIIEKRESFDMLIIEYILPNKNGLDVAKMLRKNDIDIPIIGIMEVMSEKLLKKCIDVGLDGYLIKPIYKDNLIKILDQYIDIKK